MNRAGGVTYLSSCTGRPHSSSWKAEYRGSVEKKSNQHNELQKQIHKQVQILCNTEWTGQIRKIYWGKKTKPYIIKKMKICPPYLLLIAPIIWFETPEKHTIAVAGFFCLEGFGGRVGARIYDNGLSLLVEEEKSSPWLYI